MSQKLLNQNFSANLPTTRPTKTIAKPDGTTVTLVALPILPPSPFRTTDSRKNLLFVYDEDELIADYEQRKRSIPIDVDHNIAFNKGDTRSRGWSYGLTSAHREPGLGLEPGIHGWFELNPLGHQELADKLYGYTSIGGAGVQPDSNTFKFTRVNSLALTNNPASEMPMAFSAQSQEAAYTGETTTASEDAMLEKLKAKLGLDASADEAALEAAIDTLQANTQVAAKVEAGELVPAENLSAAQAETVTLQAQTETLTVQLSTVQAELATANVELSAAREQLATLSASAHDRDCVEAVNQALSARKITPAQRDAMLAFARADLKAFSTAMSAATEVLPGGTQSAAPAAEAAADGLTPDEQAFCTAYGIKESSYLSAKRGNSTN